MGDQLHTMTSTDVGERQPSMVLIPLGATEQHGPHLPLSTDSTIATHWATRVAAELRDHHIAAVVAPALPYGSSGEHQMFPGTLSIGQDALVTVLIELIRSASVDYDRIVLLSGHAGNLEPVARTTAQMVNEGHDVTHFFPTWSPTDAANVDAHAGRTETSLMLHLDPSAVRLSDASPGQTTPVSQLMDAMATGGVGAVSESGVLGDPTGASAEEGAQLLDSLVARTVAQLVATPSAPSNE